MRCSARNDQTGQSSRGKPAGIRGRGKRGHLKTFDYFAPTGIGEASRICADYCGEARALAGGTDLLIRMRRRQWTPRAVVNLKRIAGLREISFSGELRLGALVTLNDLIDSVLIREHFPVLAHTARRMAGVQVRNLATVGGNLCNASPAADMAPPLIALQARAVIAGQRGEHTLPLDEFFMGAGRSALAPDEILREILVPHADASRTSYTKLEHREAMDIAIASVAVSIIPSGVRIVLGAVASTPRRAKRAEAVLCGQPASEERIREAARVAATEADPIDDVRGGAWYRREMVEVLTRRQLMELAGF